MSPEHPAAHAATGEDANGVEAGGHKKFFSSGASPRQGLRSAVKLSGPQKNFLTPALRHAGMRAMARIPCLLYTSDAADE